MGVIFLITLINYFYIPNYNFKYLNIVHLNWKTINNINDREVIKK